MSSRRIPLLLVIIILSLFSSFSVNAGTMPHPEKISNGERWFGIFFNDERAGFSYVRIQGDRSGYQLTSDSSVKMSGFAFSRNASMTESYAVNPDLTLRSFAVDQTIDGKHMTLKGEISPAGVDTVVDSAGSKKKKFLKSREPVYPPMAMNLIPLQKGIEPGRVYRVSMLDTEAVKLKKVKITVIGPENVGRTKAIHLRNDLYPVDNDIWVDYEGHTIKESVRDGWIVTQSEGEKTIREFIAEGALAKRDFIIDYSRVGIGETISKPSGVTKMVLELSHLPADARVPQGSVQKEEKLEYSRIILTIDNSLLTAKENANKAGEPPNNLKPIDRGQINDTVLLAKKAEIIGNEKNSDKIIEKLAFWVAAHVKDTPTANKSPSDTISKGEGDCLDRARLYSALAHAAGIPTRVVLGLAYTKDRGLLYHCWAESYSGRWLPVDPTSGEVPADATHVMLVLGDTADDLVTLSKFVGKIRAKLIELK